MDKPIIVARFVTDPAGKPTTAQAGHYNIELSVRGAPEDAYAVTYQLDDSYYDPIRESQAKDRDFVTKITSYGDYQVLATVRSRSGAFVITTDLLGALERGHEDRAAPAIAKALEEVKDN